MAIFLAQHGLSLSRDKDPEKGLSQKGKEETQKIADVAKFYKIPVTKIVHSAKKRADQTARIFKATLEINNIEQISGISPMDDVTVFGNKIDPNSSILVVGHLPYMEKLVSFLTTNDSDIRVCKFQNSGIVCLDFDDAGWFIKWILNPNIT
ncbi:MAG: phosphohistidine phosphatase SixA [Desulfobacula sp.]|nr:phosphohistidine phosphatase SixA [Desulfobacula sp.]